MIVQIGSHNGQAGDPLADLIDSNDAWRVLFVEPMPGHFASLQARRGGQVRFTLVQAAVTDHDGEVTMFTLDKTNLMPDWADQLSSIHPETVLKHAASVPGLEDAMREVTVSAMTFPTLMESVPSAEIDLLHIDTEGHDANILDQIDFVRQRPEVILFESKHLSPGDRLRCEERLISNGYVLYAYQSDTLAIRSTP